MTDMNRTTVIGLDFGSLSCRGILVDAADGSILCESEYVYPHGAMDKHLPDGTPLPDGWVLQHPSDYEDALVSVIRSLVSQSGIPAENIIAIGADSTASTVLPVSEEFRPLCIDPQFSGNIHAWPKMWKHHAAASEAKILTSAAKVSCPDITEKYGGIIGAEFMIPKVMQTCREAPEVYSAAATFIELGDWVTTLLTGKEIRSGTFLTCKSMYRKDTAYPSADFFASMDERFRSLPSKLAFRSGSSCTVAWPGESAGTLCPAMAEKTGLLCSTRITASQMDGYAGIPGCGVFDEGTLMMMLGTSNAYMLLGKTYQKVPGVCAAMEDSVLPGYVNYAAGQACVGDMFSWFIKNSVPDAYFRAAEKAGMEIHEYLSSLAEKKTPAGSGLLALDWWNGNKSILCDSSLKGLILGLDLTTTPEDIYLALIESTAFGARRIIENFEAHNVSIRHIVAGGGISRRNPLLMQIYADVTGREIEVSACPQAAALGSAVYAAAAAGIYPSVSKAAQMMSNGSMKKYIPSESAHEVYNAVYAEYLRVHDYFGKASSDIMKNIRKISDFHRKGESI